MLLTLCLLPQLWYSHSLWKQNHLVLHHCLLKNDAKHAFFSFQDQKDTTNVKRGNQMEKRIASFQQIIEKLIG